MNNEKQLKDYLNLYLGCRFWDYGSEEGHEIATITGVYNNNNVCMVCDEHGNTDIKPEEIKLILRRLESMTEEEEKHLDGELWEYGSNFKVYSPEQTIYLLSLGFDLFGLIDAGLAIDAATLIQKEDKS